MKIAKLVIIVAAFCFFVAACASSSGSNVTNTATASTPANTNSQAAPVPEQTIDQAKMAENLYTVHCMTCHKDSGKGGPVTVDGKKLDPEDLTTSKMKAKTDAKLTEYIVEGFPDDGMPAFKDKLSEGEIAALVKHLRVLQGN